VLLIVFGALGTLLATVLLSEVAEDAGHGMDVGAAAYLAGWLQLVVSGAELASGVFLWRGRAWARVVATVVCGLNILGALVVLVQGVPLALPGIGINIGLIAVVNARETADWCE
jgi:hypothetical protein